MADPAPTDLLARQCEVDTLKKKIAYAHSPRYRYGWLVFPLAVSAIAAIWLNKYGVTAPTIVLLLIGWVVGLIGLFLRYYNLRRLERRLAEIEFAPSAPA